MDKEFFVGMPHLDFPISTNTGDTVRENSEIKDMEESIASLKRLAFSNDFYADSNKRILPEFYSDNSDEGKQKLENLRRNKYRKGWFTSVIGQMQLALQLLDGQTKKQLLESIKQLSKEVLLTDQTTSTMITKAESLVGMTIKLLEEKTYN